MRSPNRIRNRNKSTDRAPSSAKKKMSRRVHEVLRPRKIGKRPFKIVDRDASSSATNEMSRTTRVDEVLDIRMVSTLGKRFSRPFKIGSYAPGTEPRRIPYHLYLLVNQAVGLMSRGLDNHSAPLKLVQKKIRFFSDFFYSHLPVGWKYQWYNAASLIAGYDASRPQYNMSGYATLGYPLAAKFDIETHLYNFQVFDIMSIIHSRKTPAPNTFWRWNEHQIAFYCKLCSCFGIDYQHLESASKNDVCLMNMGNRRSRIPIGDPYYKWVGKISSKKDVYVFKHKHMGKLSSNDEAFELSTNKILEILRIVTCSPGLPQTMLTQWNESQVSFYCKMCSCFGVDCQLINR